VQEPNQSPYPEYDRGFSNGWDRGFAAAQRQWVGLTDEEQIALLKDSDGKTRHWLVWQVEAKLKAKNG
jgi:hypothetical protein